MPSLIGYYSLILSSILSFLIIFFSIRNFKDPKTFDNRIITLSFLQFFRFDSVSRFYLIIFTFIGAMVWDINVNGSMLITLYGTIPSLISFILIVMNLIGFNYITIIQILITSLLLQLFFDSFVYLKSNVTGLRDFYYFVRFPVTLILSFLIILS